MPRLSQEIKLGRLPRTYDPRVPILHKLMETEKVAAAPPEPSVDYTDGMPADLGFMLNDKLGDCTCAAFYHAIQVWSFNAKGKMDTQPDTDVEMLYQQACGYDPNVPGEGPGGNEQAVLTYLLRTGAPCGPDGAEREKIAAFVEVDVQSTDNIKRTVADFGVCYIGLKVPQYIKPPDGSPPDVWDVEPDADNTLIGSHSVVLAGYDAKGARMISWGIYYTMTWAFFAKFVDEAYAIADVGWINEKNKTPGGLTAQQLADAMKALEQ